MIKKTIGDDTYLDITPGEQIVDMVHIDDIISAFLIAENLILEKKQSTFERYAVSSSERMTLHKLIKLIKIELDVPIRVNLGGRPYRGNEVMVPWVGQTLPKWETKVSLAIGLKEFFKTKSCS